MNKREKLYLTNEKLAARFNCDLVQLKECLKSSNELTLKMFASLLHASTPETQRLFMSQVQELAEEYADNTNEENIKQLELLDKYFGHGDYSDPDTIVERMTDDMAREIITKYNRKQAALAMKLKLKKMKPRFTTGEIVGAKDASGKWWMARILEVVKYSGGYAYYVEFCNWGPKFNLVITNPSDIRWYNPKKHRLFRGALTANIECDDISNDSNKATDEHAS